MFPTSNRAHRWVPASWLRGENYVLLYVVWTVGSLGRVFCHIHIEFAIVESCASHWASLNAVNVLLLQLLQLGLTNAKQRQKRIIKKKNSEKNQRCCTMTWRYYARQLLFLFLFSWDLPLCLLMRPLLLLLLRLWRWWKCVIRRWRCGLWNVIHTFLCYKLGWTIIWFFLIFLLQFSPL